MLTTVTSDWPASAPLPHLVAGDITRLPLRGSAVDVVLSMHTLYHVADIYGALAEPARVLRAGGTLLVIPHRAALLAYIDSLRHLTEDQLPDGLQWTVLVDEVAQRIDAQLDDGPITLTPHAGVFICVWR